MTRTARPHAPEPSCKPPNVATAIARLDHALRRPGVPLSVTLLATASSPHHGTVGAALARGGVSPTKVGRARPVSAQSTPHRASFARETYNAPPPAVVKLLQTVEAGAPRSGPDWSSTPTIHLTH
jgi:hypothetical protein